MILLDTDICIEILRGNKNVITHRTNTAEEVAVAFMSVGELFFGAYNSSSPEKNRKIVEIFLLSIRIIQSDQDIMAEFGRLKSLHTKRGTTLPDADVMIAAVALTTCRCLVTGNQKHFKRFLDLKLENWIRV